MKPFLNIALSLKRWLHGIFVRPYKTEIVQEYLPDALKKKILYVVEEDGYTEQAAMVCPCGCGKVLHLNLIPDDSPYWVVKIHHNGTASLTPSVWRQIGCKSHFWFKRGRVKWC